MPTSRSLPMRHRPAVAHLVLARDPWKITDRKAKSWRFGRFSFSNRFQALIFQGRKEKKRQSTHTVYFYQDHAAEVVVGSKFLFGRIGPPKKIHPMIFWLGIAQILETKSLDMHYAVIRPDASRMDSLMWCDESAWRYLPKPSESAMKKCCSLLGINISWVDDFPFPEVGYATVPWKVLPCCHGLHRSHWITVS